MASPRRSIILAALGGAAVTAFAVALVGFPLALTHRTDLPLERAYTRAVITLIVRLQAGSAENPRTADPAALTTGRNAYTGSCAMCHGGLGDGRGAFGRATYPDAADLTSPAVKGRSDAELFWLTKHGLSFTAMPGFASDYRDLDIWAIVVYLRALQRGTERSLEVAPPTAADLARADPHGDAPARGAAVYFAMGCFQCHGPEGNGPGDLDLLGRFGRDVVRKGERGMPSFDASRISERELADLEAFLLARDDVRRR